MLARVDYGRLATVHQNQPYIVPIYFAYDREYLYGFTTLGCRSYRRNVQRPVTTSAAPQTKLKLNQALRRSARPNLR
jgi:nitroimidazol reductase NimA-like FMN-containing flavoprotein (pyridoxamine 5'-phosphate oxidase superfamily)